MILQNTHSVQDLNLEPARIWAAEDRFTSRDACLSPIYMYIHSCACPIRICDALHSTT